MLARLIALLCLLLAPLAMADGLIIIRNPPTPISGHFPFALLEYVGRGAFMVRMSADNPLKSVCCPSHEVEIRRDGDKSAIIGFQQRNARPDTDF